MGGIYALERISNESEKDYWPIMEILTAYVRKNSSIEVGGNRRVTHISMDIQVNDSKKDEIEEVEEISLDIEAILTVHWKTEVFLWFWRIHSFESVKNLFKVIASLKEFHFERANFGYAYLENAYLGWSHFRQAIFVYAHLENAYLGHAYLENAVFIDSHLGNADFSWANLKDALLIKADMKGTIFRGTHLEYADLYEAHLEGAYFIGADLRGAKNLTVDQLSKVKTLYNSKLDPERETALRAEVFGNLLDEGSKDERDFIYSVRKH